MATLFHYTDAKGHQGILDTQVLLPSTVTRNPRDVRYGDGQYLCDVLPGKLTLSQLSRVLLGHPFSRKRFTHYIEIDVTGLVVTKCREHVYLIANDQPLDLKDRIIRSGGT